ncbi:MAG: TetR family transcriptional regulator [Chloroflexota bacterium]
MLLKQKKLDPRVIRTRRDLAASMCTLLRTKPFNQITVQEIAEQAIINRATFYAHFEDKYKLLEFMVQGSFQEKLESKVGTCVGMTPEHLRLLTLATCEFLGEFDDKYAPRKGQEYPPIERQIQPYIYKLLLEWAKASGIAEQVELAVNQSAETVAMTISWAIFGSALQWSRGSRELSAEEQSEQIVALLLSGVGALLVDRVFV